MLSVGAKDLVPNPAYDSRRPMFNSRDEALAKKGAKEN
jgi:hypothetical protein